MLKSQIEAREGFTLIEIVIAIAIVAFMMAAVTVGFNFMRKRGALTSTKTSLQNIQTAINMYKTFVGTYPQSLNDLREKPSDPRAASKWPGTLLEKEPEDAWGQSFHYQLTRGGKHPYELYSDGDPDEPENRIDVWDI